MVDTTELLRLHTRISRERISADIQDFLKMVLPLIVGLAHQVDSPKATSVQKAVGGTCPVCQARRKAKTQTMRRYRAKRNKL